MTFIRQKNLMIKSVSAGAPCLGTLASQSYESYGLRPNRLFTFCLSYCCYLTNYPQNIVAYHNCFIQLMDSQV